MVEPYRIQLSISQYLQSYGLCFAASLAWDSLVPDLEAEGLRAAVVLGFCCLLEVSSSISLPVFSASDEIGE
jgi:hypothetical protein